MVNPIGTSTPSSLPLVITPQDQHLNLTSWKEAHGATLQRDLHRHGAILLRRFPISDAATFEKVFTDLAGDLMSYQYGSTPRHRVHGLLYSSTEYPADQSIPLHNEESYARSWPMRLGFFCVQPARVQGETPLADSRQVYAKIPLSIRQRFTEKKLLYVRNYGTGLDLSWENVFQTTQPSVVEQYCRQAGISFEWHGKALRTWQICPAVAMHPYTGEPVWFNQAHLFHPTSLPTPTREALLDCLPETELPRQVYYGDGTAIEWDALDEIRRVYREHTVMFPWEKGDVLLLDNMLTAHGRSAYEGHRTILVGMAAPYGLHE